MTKSAELVSEARAVRRLPRLQELSLVAIIAALCVVLSYFGWRDAPPGYANLFLNPDNLIDGIATPMSVYAIMAVGATCVIITAGIDISVGAIFALSALVAAAVLQEMPRDASPWKVIPVAVVVPAAVGTLCGLVNGVLVVVLRIHPFIVTLGTMVIFRGLANVTTPEKRRPDSRHFLPDVFSDQFMRYQVGGIRPMPMLVMLLCVALGAVYLHLTVAGRKNYAIGGNEEAARYSGVRVGPVKLLVYAISGLTAGIAGMVSLGRYATISTNTASGYELMVIAAAVVGGASLMGGRGSAIGALLGTLVIAIIGNGIYTLHMDEEYRSIIVGTAILVAAALDSRITQRLRGVRAT
jgi:ribose/xylose/arabinose/galactoside ABC-type transport system permease subunit